MASGVVIRRTVLVADLRRALQSSETAAELRAQVKAIAYPEPIPSTPGAPQLALWSIDGEGLPPRPWRIQATDAFDCVVLGCTGMTAGVCVARQQATDAQRTRQASRGQGTDYPHCDTRTCVQGRAIREALEARLASRWRGAGPGGRFDRGRKRSGGMVVP